MVLTIPNERLCHGHPLRICVCNIFKGKFEKLHIHPYLRNFSFLWNGTKSKAIKFADNLQKIPKTIRTLLTMPLKTEQSLLSTMQK